MLKKGDSCEKEKQEKIKRKLSKLHKVKRNIK